jgi:hypothetical protein
MKTTKQPSGTDATSARRAAYSLARDLPDDAAWFAKLADEREAKEPIAWQPAGSIPINKLLANEAKRSNLIA